MSSTRQGRLGALTVIAGADSTGKSSVLQAVLAMSQVTRRRITGRRFPLNGEFAQLGTFTTVRHQRADPVEPVRIGMRFSTPEPQPLDVHWAIELDSATTDQIGSSQISAIEVHAEGDELATSLRLDRADAPSLVSRQHSDLAEGLAFTGTIRSADSEIAVLDALISSGQVSALFGTPPPAPVRVRLVLGHG